MVLMCSKTLEDTCKLIDQFYCIINHIFTALEMGDFQKNEVKV